ncbi:MAG: DNA/RNA non-specific endonuclease [Bacteroidales bacterium]|nr:DNA/RNA non-specific endonuclease [Bacteroidales bacterium]
MSTYNKFAKYLTMMAVMLAATTACEDVDDDGDIFNVQPDGDMIDPDAPGVDEVSSIPLTRYTARMETPALQQGNIFIEHSTFERDDSLVNYMLEYSTEHYLPRWVAFRFDARNRATVANRKSYDIKPQFPADPDLGSKGLSSDAPFKGFQHGHLCASNDRRNSREANDQTFYMSNVMPQSGNFNGIQWVYFESFVQTLGRSESFADTLYVVKGGTLDNIRQNITVDGHTVPVPQYFWMALLRVKGSNYAALGFWVEHRDNYVELTATEISPMILEHCVTINQLETLTGINFFPNLPDDIERTVEANFTAAAWGL